MRRKKEDNIEGPIVKNTTTIFFTIGLVFVVVLIAAGIISGFSGSSGKVEGSDNLGMIVSIIGFILFIIVVYIFIKNLFFNSSNSGKNLRGSKKKVGSFNKSSSRRKSGGSRRRSAGRARR